MKEGGRRGKSEGDGRNRRTFRERGGILKMEEGIQEPSKAGGLQTLRKAREQVLPQSLQTGTQPCYRLDFSPARPMSDL